MKSDMGYFLQAVKDWLNVSPSQAGYFKQLTKGGEIPPRFIGETHIKKKKVRIVNTSEGKDYEPPKDWTIEDLQCVRNNWDIIPNYDFDPDYAPKWWPEYKERVSKITRPSIRRQIYDEYIRKELNDYDKRS